MSVGYDRILCMNNNKQTWYKWDYVCSFCDALIEVTALVDGHSIKSEICMKCLSPLTLMSVADATIVPSTEKENPNMEQTLSTEYNPNALVTYKKIAGTYASPEAPEYITTKVVDLEWELEHLRQSKTTLNKLEDKLIQVQDIILAQYQDSDDQQVLESIADILNIELTKEITWSATVEVSGTIQVSLTEDYDLELMITDELNVSAWGGNIEVGDYEVTNVREDY